MVGTTMHETVSDANPDAYWGRMLLESIDAGIDAAKIAGKRPCAIILSGERARRLLVAHLLTLDTVVATPATPVPKHCDLSIRGLPIFYGAVNDPVILTVDGMEAIAAQSA